MGISMSRRRAARAKAKSNLIDRQIEEDNKRLRRRCRILLLGTSGSGKSTIFQQTRMIYQDDFSTSEFRPTVYKNVLESAQAIVIYMRKLGLECADVANNIHCDKILNYKLDASPGSLQNPYFSSDIANAIHRVWKDHMIANIMDEHSGEFYLMDSAAYFFDEVLRIGMPGYLPNKVDVLHAHQKSVGIAEAEFMMGQLSIHITDIADQRPSRKWVHCFESATSVIFCAAISEYDQVLLEEKSQNRLRESILLFDSIINSRWFLRTSFILYLTKIDVFKHKISKVPLERYFPEYTGGNDVNKTAKYILWQFMQTNRARLSVYPHLVQATDITDAASVRLVFTVVKETILQNALKDRNII